MNQHRYVSHVTYRLVNPRRIRLIGTANTKMESMTKYKITAYRTECMTSTVTADSYEEAKKLWQRGLTDLTDEYNEPTEWEIEEIETL